MNILLPNVEGDVNTMSNEQILSQIDWSRADQTIKLLKPTGVKIRGYNVVDETPTDRVPSWLAKMSTERLRQFLPAYVKTMITRYPEISEWAIVLEPLWSDGKGWAGFASNSFWYSRLGKDYFKIAFKAAKEANLKIEAMLVENLSYGNHTNIVLNEEFYALYNLVAELKQNSVPIDHVGLETHLLARDFKTEADINQFKQELIQAMQKLAGLGVKVDITELDVNLAGVPGSEAEQLAWQAKIYRAATEAAVESGVCSSLTFWGFTDAATWIGTPGYPYGEGKAPLLLDANYQPKPALKTVADALKAATGR
jgi:endo-1,4-beta-xylanase